ncbi:type II toxin-antitoxin system RelE/ParE family toxin [Ekhidna sp.]|uniref:type II toxin-antitoxin system RelE/ParE family toxin n=1 Tax=Ekhidna sp. TaxID=2608089 RepID=UPI0032EF2FE4
MVKEVVWTQTAYSQKIEVYEYWNKKNGSSSFSEKLEKTINDAIDLIKKFPQLGVKTQLKNVRIKIIKNYLLIYRVSEDTLFILLFWDSRQNPKDLDRLIKLYQ